MNQKQYLRALNRSLFPFVSWGERQDILSDYREYFADAMREDGSEPNLIDRFGTPAQAAKSILTERGGLQISKHVLFKVLSLAASVLLLVYAVYICHRTFSYRDYWFLFWIPKQYSGILLFCVTAAIFVLCSQPWREESRRIERSRVNRSFWIVTGLVSLILVLMETGFISLILLERTRYFLFPPYFLDPYFQTVFRIAAGMVFVVWLWLLLSSRNHTVAGQSLNFWFAGLIGIMMNGVRIIKNQDIKTDYVSAGLWFDWLWPLAVGIVLTGAAVLAAYLLEKRRR